ncbi:glutamine synthetase [Baekduia soli]|uniref:Glutamine synthetase n=1 Tax=Baekduia soli TaxID=496014 RepID=A0A5B8U070_9ACTN|nr:glutamine synthetase family protein [Baekduia soli]QEC46355.1 glutamine synthetase [Baekduia soli]
MSEGRLTLDDLLGGRFESVILATVDVQGRLVGKRMSPRAFAQKLPDGIHVCTCTLAWDMDQALEGLAVPFAGEHTGWHDFMVRPELSTLRVAGWAQETAICLGDAVDDRGGLVPVSPRTILRRQITALADLGLHARVSTELEFFLFRTTYDDARRVGYANLEPTTLTHADYAVQQTEDLEPFFRPARQALAASGLDVELSQGEWGLGQWEMNLPHDEALAMADAHVLFKLGLKRMASRAGLAATFMARPSTEAGIGSSCHIHVSLTGAGGESLFFDPSRERAVGHRLLHAVGGVLDRAPELMQLYAPTVNSYRRTASDDFAGRGRTWGFDNRTVSCRVVGDQAESIRLEYRVPGADVNPYLAIAGLLASVADGLQRQLDPGPPLSGSSYELDIAPLPPTLERATERFATSDFAKRVFGQDVVEHYAVLSRHETRMFNTSVTDWEKHRYFELI